MFFLSPALAAGGSDRHFSIVVDGVEPRALSRWWRDLCSQEPSKAPEAFREIYPKVRLFEGNTFHFKSGEPEGIRNRLQSLLDMYGAHPSQLKLEYT